MDQIKYPNREPGTGRFIPSNYRSLQVCPFCSKRFLSNQWKYDQHLRSHTGDRPFRCDYHGCNSTYTRKEYLTQHRLSHPGGTARFVCEFCEKRFSRKLKYEEHLRTHARENPFPCEAKDCGYAYSTKYQLTELQLTHDASTAPVICEFCQKAFLGSSRKYEEHLRTHTKERPLRCDIAGCDLTFKRQRQLNDHVRVHAGVLPRKRYRCSVENCHATFVGSTGLKFHQMSHRGEKPFKCEAQGCGKEFVQKGNLKMHMAVHEAEPIERSFHCNTGDCGKSFAKEEALKRHQKTHSKERSFLCVSKGCSQRFKDKRSLKSHESLYTGEKPFRCTFQDCGRSFAHKHTLRTHFRIHTGEKPYQCTFAGCQLTFRQITSLNLHLITHSDPSGEHKCRGSKTCRERPLPESGFLCGGHKSISVLAISSRFTNYFEGQVQGAHYLRRFRTLCATAQSSNRSTKESSQAITKEIERLRTKVMEYREANILILNPETQKYRDTWIEQCPSLVFVDTEHINVGGESVLFEICILGSQGEEVLNTIINHQCTIAQLYDRVRVTISEGPATGCVRKIYGPPSDEITPGMTIQEVADALEGKGFGDRT